MENHIDTEKLSSFLDGLLAAEEEDRIKEHLSGCPVCGVNLELLRRTSAALRELPIETLPPEAASRLTARLGMDKEEAPQVHRPWWNRVALAALVPAAATLLVLALLVTYQSTVSQPELKSIAPPNVPSIIAEFPNSNQAERSLPLSPAAPTNGAAEGTKSDDKSAGAVSPLPPVVIGIKDYGPPEIVDLLNANFRRPEPGPQQRRLLIDMARDEGDGLAAALSAARLRQPDAVPIYAELARFQGKRVWIIVTEEGGQRRALVVKAKTGDR